MINDQYILSLESSLKDARLTIKRLQKENVMLSADFFIMFGIMAIFAVCLLTGIKV